MADTSYNYSGAQGIYSFPNISQSFSGNETTATAETPVNNSIIRDVPSTPQLSLGSSILNAAGNAASSAISSPVSSFLTWFEGGISDTLVRGGVVVLGFILVAAGLYAFSGHSVNVVLKK